jgi:hypothetical protein
MDIPRKREILLAVCVYLMFLMTMVMFAINVDASIYSRHVCSIFPSSSSLSQSSFFFSCYAFSPLPACDSPLLAFSMQHVVSGVALGGVLFCLSDILLVGFAVFKVAASSPALSSFPLVIYYISQALLSQGVSFIVFIL